MSRSTRDEREAARAAAEVARRAIRRLDVLEWVFLGGAILMAVLGGGLVAWLIAPGGGQLFRGAWVVSSVLLVVVPGFVVLLRAGREEFKGSSGGVAGRRKSDVDRKRGDG